MDKEEERLNGDMAGPVSPQQSPMSPRASQAAPTDALGLAVLSFDSQVKTSPSEEIVGKQSPSGFQDERKEEKEDEEAEKHGIEDKSKAFRSDLEEELVESPAMPDSHSNIEDQQEEQENDVEEAEEDEPEVVPPVHSTVIPDASLQKDESFDMKPCETLSQPQMTPDEAKKRGLSFDYTESDLVHQETPDRWENGSDKTPPLSKSPDSCRADPGSPFSPSTAPDQTQESPLTDHQNEAQEEPVEEPVEEQEPEVISIPTAQQEVIVPKMEPEVDTKPEDSKEDKPEKYLETTDEDLIATVEVAQSAEPVAQPEEEAAAAAVADVEVDPGEPYPPEPVKAAPTKTVPVKDAAIKKAKKPIAAVAAAPAPKSTPKLEKVPSKDAAPVGKTSTPSKGLFFLPFLNPPLNHLLSFFHRSSFLLSSS